MLATTNFEGSRPLLVLTALEETWGASEPLLFLGEWCKRYERRDVWESRNHTTVPFHWDDRNKLRQDYDYLESLHKTLLSSLAESLNQYHGVSFDDRYWQIQLDPWLMSYLGVMFDRWESLRYAFQADDSSTLLSTVWLEENFAAPYSYNEFVQAAAYSDRWNQWVYQRILYAQYLDKLTRIAGQNCPSGEVCLAPRSPQSTRSPLKKLQALFRRLRGSLARSPRVVFLGTTFSPVAFVKLSLRLGQLPYRILALEELLDAKKSPPSASSPPRSRMRLDWIGESDFERFIKSSIIADLPICTVEDYSTIRSQAHCISIRPKVVVTGSSHWDDPLAKTWIAEQAACNTKFVVLEHGGSLPPYKELFDFELSIADVRASWFRPYHVKHRQLPPPRLVEQYGAIFRIRRRLNKANCCSLIANECASWVHRVHFYPMANQWSDSFSMVLDLYNRLNPKVRNAFRIKPYPASQGWNTAQRFADALGSDVLHKERSLERVYAMSKVIICSYPETTFSEAMASGVPTILMYPEHYYELNPVAYPLLSILRSAKVAFNDPAEAALHLNSIWDCPDEWWRSSETKYARHEFCMQALDHGPGWLSKWAKFLASECKPNRSPES